MAYVSLKCLSGPLEGKVFDLEGGPVFIFGRYSRAHFSLASDLSASQLHFLIDISDNRVRIIDLGSTNGLVVNETLYSGKYGKVPAQFVTLKNGDTIIAGSNHFVVNINEADEPGEPVRSGTIKLNAGAPDKSQTVRQEKSGDLSETGNASAPGKFNGESGFPEIEGYTILERIGIGGRGAVFKAIKDSSGEKTALKILLPRTSKKSRALESFRREILINKELSHPNIIRYIDDGLCGDLPYLALEYVNGGNLDQLLRSLPDRKMPFNQAIPLFIQILEATSYMHQKGFVHKDIKPKNILLDLRRGGGMASKLSDMGLSGRISNTEGEFLPAVNEGGTPAYMPPEQLTDITKSLPQSDVFSIAATMYQMLSGRLLYDFKDKDQVATILDGNIPPILTLCPELPGRFAEVINKALSYYPENRFPDAEAMLEALRSALQ